MNTTTEQERYFFYSYASTKGFGSGTVEQKNGEFPSKNEIKNQTSRLFDSIKPSDVIILNISEMTKADYLQWNA